MKCPGCSSTAVERLGPYRGIRAPFLGLERVACKACGLVFVDPFPDSRELEEYNAGYFTSAHGGIPREPAAIAFFQAMAELRVAHIAKYAAANRASPRTVLEVGPGPGFFARAWLATHRDSAYYAQETDAEARASLAGLGVTLVEPDAEVEVDLLVMSHVVEHVADPIGFLRKNTSRLKKGGVLFVEVPCRDDLHKSQDEPHLLFFEKASLRNVLEQVSVSNVQLTYHGKSLADLRKPETVFSRRWNALRTQLIMHGLSAPFALPAGELRAVRSITGRALIAPFGAHRLLEEPAWWLRACAIKE